MNLMKGAIECSDIVSTVSPTYAEELKRPEFSFGLDPIVRKNEGKLRGILNGIDTVSYNPSKDKAIPANYSWRKPEGKAVCKADLQESLGLPVRDVPVIAMITRMVAAKGMDLVVDSLDRVLNDMDVQFILLGTGDQKYEEFFRGLQHRHPDKAVCMIEFNVGVSRRIYAGADIFLMPSRSEACGLAQMIACRYGNVPLVRQTGGLADSIHEWDGEKGNGFTFYDYNGTELAYAVGRALDLYDHRNKWRALVRHILDEDFSWSRSAEEYRDVYRQVTGRS